MVVISHIPEGGLSPLLQASGEGGGGGGEGPLAAAHAACLVPQEPVTDTQTFYNATSCFKQSE